MAKPSALLLRKCDEYQSRAALISLTIMLFLATIVVAVRLYIRLFIVHGCGYDDYFILGSLVSYPAAQCPSLTKIRSPAVLRSACTSNNLQRGWESLHTACRSNKSSILRNGPFFPALHFHHSLPLKDISLSFCVTSLREGSEEDLQLYLASDILRYFDNYFASYSIPPPVQAPRSSLEYECERSLLLHKFHVYDCIR